MTLTNLTIDKFIEATGSGEPVPGGGSISALCGSISAALAEMVARLTIGKKKYADVQEKMEQLTEKLNPASSILMKAVNLDSEAYDQVFQAYKLPKETEEEKEFRAATIQQALIHAATVPFSVAQITNTFLSDIETLAECGNQNAITDAYVAALCARTAIMGACANARINLCSIKDTELVNQMKKDIAIFEKNASETETKVAAMLNKALA